MAGKEEWVQAAAARLSAPGLGVDCGSTPGDIMRTLFQGLFLAPQMVGEAMKVKHIVPHSQCKKLSHSGQQSVWVLLLCFFKFF